VLSCKLVIKDEVNIKLEGLPVEVRRKLSNTFKYEDPTARYRPAYKLGRWDGTVTLFGLGGSGYLHQLPKILEVLESNGVDVEDVEDFRSNIEIKFPEISTDFWGAKTWPKGHRYEGEPIRLREDQVEVINKFLKHPQCLQEIATGFGKTITTATLSKVCEPYGRTITIVPNKSLVEQTEEDFINCGLDVGVYYGDRKELNRTHTICTWQSLNVLDKKNKDALDNLQMDVFLKDLTAIIVDECHAIKDLNILHKLLTTVFKNIPIRWGLTGTIPEEEYKQMGLFTAIGPQIGILTAKELQDKGVLAQCHVTVLQTQETLQYGNYQEELKHLLTNDQRLTWMAGIIEEIANSGNTLVLVDRIETGQKLYNQLSDSVFISGEMKSQDRREHYKEINFSDNKIMVATYGTTSTGINISRIFNLVLVEAGKSFVRTIQSIGRGLRMADDKDRVEIYDLCSRMKFSNNHLNKRKQFYNKAQYPYVIKKITY